MQADFGGGRLLIARLPSRRARAHLFTVSGRSLLIGVIAAVTMTIVGFSIAVGHAGDPAPLVAAYGLIGR